jgi:hypothetical protein
MSFQIRPKLRSKLPQLVAGLALAIAAASSASADELTTPPAPTASEQANRPARGMSMEKVEATFGAPTNRAPAVGEPPITRWEYPGFVVYFEHQYVIHTVGVG